MLKTISIIVSGKVQGVFFRQSTREKAREIGVNGRINNQADGNVYIIATGTETQLDALAAWCRNGPPKADVVSVDIRELPLQYFEQFTVERY